LQETDSALARRFEIAVHHHDRMSSFA
ncbi:MAG: hypothetical protein RI941_1103, partial [Pseudomonadota bacterium]